MAAVDEEGTVSSHVSSDRLQLPAGFKLVASSSVSGKGEQEAPKRSCSTSSEEVWLVQLPLDVEATDLHGQVVSLEEEGAFKSETEQKSYRLFPKKTTTESIDDSFVLLPDKDPDGRLQLTPRKVMGKLSVLLASMVPQVSYPEWTDSKVALPDNLHPPFVPFGADDPVVLPSNDKPMESKSKKRKKKSKKSSKSSSSEAEIVKQEVEEEEESVVDYDDDEEERRKRKSKKKKKKVK